MKTVFIPTVTRHVLILTASIQLFNIFSKKKLERDVAHRSNSCWFVLLSGDFWERREECCDVFQVHSAFALFLYDFVNTSSLKCKIHLHIRLTGHQRSYYPCRSRDKRQQMCNTGSICKELPQFSYSLSFVGGRVMFVDWSLPAANHNTEKRQCEMSVCTWGQISQNHSPLPSAPQTTQIWWFTLLLWILGKMKITACLLHVITVIFRAITGSLAKIPVTMIRHQKPVREKPLWRIFLLLGAGEIRLGLL